MDASTICSLKEQSINTHNSFKTKFYNKQKPQNSHKLLITGFTLGWDRAFDFRPSITSRACSQTKRSENGIDWYLQTLDWRN